MIAPPGKLALVFHMHTDGHAIVTNIRPESPLAGRITVGDIVLAVDGEDTSLHTEQEICDHILEKQNTERVLTIIPKKVQRESVSSLPRIAEAYKDTPPLVMT